MHSSHSRIIHLFRRVRHGGQIQRRNCRGSVRNGFLVSDRNNGERHFAIGVETQQGVYLRVDEPGDDVRGKFQRVCDCEQVGEDRAIVPAEMTISAGAVFPGVPPICARANDDDRGMGYGWVVGGSLNHNLAEITGAKLAQSEFCSSKVIHARRKRG